MPPIDLTDADPRVNAVWHALLDIAEAAPSRWTLIGAQMVRLLGLEHGRPPTRASLDGDVAVDAQVAKDAIATFVSCLCDDLGFQLVGVGGENLGHRFSRGDAVIDVLASEPIRDGDERRLRTVGSARTVVVPGSRQALSRSRSLKVQVDRRTGHLPCPTLLGGVLVKARAVAVDDLPEAQLADVAFLLELIDAPDALADELRATESKWLRRLKTLAEPEFWERRGPAGVAGYATYSILTTPG